MFWRDLIPPLMLLAASAFAPAPKWAVILTAFLAGYGICTALRDEQKRIHEEEECTRKQNQVT